MALLVGTRLGPYGRQWDITAAGRFVFVTQSEPPAPREVVVALNWAQGVQQRLGRGTR